MRHGVRLARRRRQGRPEVARHRHRGRRDAKRLSRDAAAAQPGSHSSSAPAVAPADRDRRQCSSS